VIYLNKNPLILPLNNNTMADLSQQDWEEQLEKDSNAVILDVRAEEELEDGIIPNSINIDIYKGQEFVDELEKLDKSKNYYVYCRSGNRSGQACAIMKSIGFDKAYNLEGGFMNWEGETT
jgi:rhodanese-related sulfurtransferase